MSTVLVCGGRGFGLMWDAETFQIIPNEIERFFLYTTLTHLHAQCEFTKLVHGKEPKGADMLAEKWALHTGILVRGYEADWRRFGKPAGHIRNQEMYDREQPKLVVAFKGNAGTKNMINIARRAGVQVVTPGWEY